MEQLIKRQVFTVKLSRHGRVSMNLVLSYRVRNRKREVEVERKRERERERDSEMAKRGK